MPHHILIADDETVIRRLLTIVLESNGYRVTAVNDGAQAIAQLHSEIPDLVFCDLMIPELDGAGILREMKSRPEWQQIPVVILTASDSQQANKALAIGATRCLIKPFAKAQVIALLAELLAADRFN